MAASKPAARVGDPITHSNAMAGLLVGLGAGLIIGAVIVGSGGTAAPLLIAAGAATGGSLGGTLGKFLGGLTAVPKGLIVDGSPNVSINGRKAAFCSSRAACSDHPGPVVVAQGSTTVAINGRPAARTNDLGACGFKVGQGSPNVRIGGALGACAPVASEVPWQADAALMLLGLAGGGYLLALKGLTKAQIAARFAAGLLGGSAGGAGMHWAGGQLFGDGSNGQSAMAFAGSFAGGGWGFRQGARLDATPRLNPFNYRPVVRPGTLGSTGGNVGARYAGPPTRGTDLTARPLGPARPPGPGLEARGYRPQPGERATTRAEYYAARSEARAQARATRLEAADGGHSLARHGPGISDAALDARVRTAIAPDGAVSSTRASTRFNTNRDWVETRQRALRTIEDRNGVDLSQPPAPGQPTQYRVTTEHGRAIDDGFIGHNPAHPQNAGIQVPHPTNPSSTVRIWPTTSRVDGLTRTFTNVRWDAATGRWKVVQHFPTATGWDQGLGRYTVPPTP